MGGEKVDELREETGWAGGGWGGRGPFGGESSTGYARTLALTQSGMEASGGQCLETSYQSVCLCATECGQGQRPGRDGSARKHCGGRRWDVPGPWVYGGGRPSGMSQWVTCGL